MIPLHPLPQVERLCPHDHTRLEVEGWYIPGMRTLAELRCPTCGRLFYADLPAGHGLSYPMLLDRATGEVHDAYGVAWFAAWLRASYADRKAAGPPLEIVKCLPIEQPILVNCIDALYGHCLLKLLNIQYYLDHCKGLQVIALVPRFLAWMVPDGVAEVWIVDIELRHGTLWSDGLADTIRREIERHPSCYLSRAFSHPLPSDVSIQRFTRVEPFDLDSWEDSIQRPIVTLIWREDRVWHEPRPLIRKVLRRAVPGLFQRWLRNRQRRDVIRLSSQLRGLLPSLDLAVVGLATPGGFPQWITDLRTPRVTAEVEGSWCRRYAQSHAVVGVHGSNMLLPSAHAGGVVDIMPADRWGNLAQDILFRDQDERLSTLTHRFLPASSSPTEVAAILGSLLTEFESFRRSMGIQLNEHRPNGSQTCASL
jgi:hypothetical protein